MILSKTTMITKSVNMSIVNVSKLRIYATVFVMVLVGTVCKGRFIIHFNAK
jgi:hypothetical protein